MSIERPRIRPRLRAAESAPPKLSRPGETVNPLAPVHSEPEGLPVLARLPEVSAPSDRTRLSLQLDRLKNLDWKRVRQVNLDPNWVAGGVLVLVLFLLLVITLNRSQKPGSDATAGSEASTWNGSGKTAAPTTLSATPNVAANASSILPNSAISSASTSVGGAAHQAAGAPGPSYAEPVAASQAATNTQGQFSLEGVFYPVTPFAAPFAVAAQPATEHAVNQPGGSVYGRELRTAQRDVGTPQYPQYPQPQPGTPQTGRPQFEGIISQP